MASSKKKVTKKYACKNVALWHPFLQIRIPVGGAGVELVEDGWLSVQEKAGKIYEVTPESVALSDKPRSEEPKEDKPAVSMVK